MQNEEQIARSNCPGPQCYTLGGVSRRRTAVERWGELLTSGAEVGTTTSALLENADANCNEWAQVHAKDFLKKEKAPSATAGEADLRVRQGWT